jgi:hypothetical protein
VLNITNEAFSNTEDVQELRNVDIKFMTLTVFDFLNSYFECILQATSSPGLSCKKIQDLLEITVFVTFYCNRLIIGHYQHWNPCTFYSNANYLPEHFQQELLLHRSAPKTNSKYKFRICMNLKISYSKRNPPLKCK